MIDKQPAAQRMHTDIGWLDSWHSFSFGEHYDPSNTHHGLLLVHNDDTVAPGGGFQTHAHRDMEIVSWVLEGALQHRDSAGHEGVITPGLAQRMSAGSGIRHSEMNASRDEPVHFLQMWVPPDTASIEPSYEQRDVGDALQDGVLVPIASGREPDAIISFHQRDATLWVARLDANTAVSLPQAPWLHVFVARGEVDLGAEHLTTGDAARVSDEARLTATATAPCELVVWEMHATAR